MCLLLHDLLTVSRSALAIFLLAELSQLTEPEHDEQIVELAQVRVVGPGTH
jgi:hypothetical protein